MKIISAKLGALFNLKLKDTQMSPRLGLGVQVASGSHIVSILPKKKKNLREVALAFLLSYLLNSIHLVANSTAVIFKFVILSAPK